MNWSNYTDVSAYFKTLIPIYFKPIKFVGLDTSKGTAQIINNKESEFPLLIIDEIKTASDKTMNLSLIERNVITLFIFEYSKTAAYEAQNSKYDSAREIAKDFIAKINEDFYDDDNFELDKALVENVDFNANIIGVQVDLHIKGSLIEFKSERWR